MAGFVPLPCDVRVLELVRAHIKRGTDADAIDPAVDGLAVMEIQRANPHLDNGDVVFIGGFAQLTTVTADCVTSRIIHRWPDKVRERIGYIGGGGPSVHSPQGSVYASKVSPRTRNDLGNVR